jgi:hypothetical protein
MAASGLAPVGTAKPGMGRQTEFKALLAGYFARLADGWRLLRREAPQVIPVDRAITLSSREELDDQDWSLVRNGERIRLELGDEVSIDASMTLPFAARADLEALIALWIEGESPFPAEETRAIWRISPPLKEKVTVEIAIFERKRIDDAIESIESKGAMVASLSRHKANGDMWEALPFWHQADVAKPSFNTFSPMLRGTILGGILAAASLAVAVAFAEMRVEALRPSASVALESLAAEARRNSQLGELRMHQGLSVNLLAIMENLAAKLPDGAWVEQVSLDEGKLTLLAYAPSSTATLDIVVALPGVKDVVIEGSIMRDATAGLERFKMAMTITGQQTVGLRP